MDRFISEGLELPPGMNAFDLQKDRFVRWLSNYGGPVSDKISREKGLAPGWILHKGDFLNWSTGGYFEMSSKDSARFNEMHPNNIQIISSHVRVAPLHKSHNNTKKAGAEYTLGCVRNSFKFLSSDSSDNDSKDRASQFTYLPSPTMKPKAEKQNPDYNSNLNATQPTQPQAQQAQPAQPPQPSQYIHPMVGKNVLIVGGIRKDRRGLVLSKCTAHHSMFNVRIHNNGEIRRIGEPDLQILAGTQQGEQASNSGLFPPDFFQVKEDFERKEEVQRAERKETAVITHSQLLNENDGDASEQRVSRILAEVDAGAAVFIETTPATADPLDAPHADGNADADADADGDTRMSSTESAILDVEPAQQCTKRRRSYSAAPIGCPLTPTAFATIAAAAIAAGKEQHQPPIPEFSNNSNSNSNSNSNNQASNQGYRDRGGNRPHVQPVHTPALPSPLATHPPVFSKVPQLPPPSRPPAAVPRTLSKGDTVRIICGDYAGNMAQVCKAAKVGAHIIPGSHTVRVHDSVRSLVILPDCFLWKAAWGPAPTPPPFPSVSASQASALPCTHPQQAHKPAVSVVSNASSESLKLQADKHSARSMGLMFP